MNTGPTTQSSLLGQNKKSPERDASQSALYHLSHEVSKLASPVHYSFMETDSVWFVSEEDAQQSLHCSTSLIHQVKNVKSPLKILNLINQQCERLLNQSEDEEQGHSPLLISDFGHSNVSLPPKAAQPLNPERHCQLNKGCSLKDTDVCPVKPVVTENTKMIPPETWADTVDAPQTSELKFNVALDLGSDWTEECLSTQCTFYDLLPEPHTSEEHLTFRSNDTAPLIPLDHNANICSNPDEMLKSLLKSEESCTSGCSFQPQPTCEDPSEEIPRFSAENRLPHSTPLANDDGVQHSTWRSKRRKQPCPIRSASVQDPDFQGVAFRMDTELDDSKDQCRLLITSKYSTDLPKNVKRTKLRTRMSQKLLKTSSDEDSDSATSDAKSKVCASCCTSKTPMWRDAEDGTPLCNACGIRYKKYRVRCINCWHIPKKDGNSVSRCNKCGHFVRLTLAQRRPTL